jgi:hypothetical protein
LTGFGILRGRELSIVSPFLASLHFKPVGKFWSVRVGVAYRAIAVPDGEDYIWVWIGPHDEYDRLVRNR